MHVRFIKFACICTHNAYLLKAEYPNCLQISYDRGMPRVVGRNAGCCKQMATWYSTLPLSCNNLSFMLREWSTTVYTELRTMGFLIQGNPLISTLVLIRIAGIYTQVYKVYILYTQQILLPRVHT